MTINEIKKAHAPMTHRQWLDKLDKEEAIFRMFGGWTNKWCCNCTHYRRDSNGDFMCYSSEHEIDCREDFNEWLNERME